MSAKHRRDGALRGPVALEDCVQRGTELTPAHPPHAQLLPSPSVAARLSRATGDAIDHDSRCHADALQQVWHDSQKQ